MEFLHLPSEQQSEFRLHLSIPDKRKDCGSYGTGTEPKQQQISVPLVFLIIFPDEKLEIGRWVSDTLVLLRMRGFLLPWCSGG